MLILLALVAYAVFGLPFVAWLGHRLALAHPDTAEVLAARQVAPEVVAK